MVLRFSFILPIEVEQQIIVFLFWFVMQVKIETPNILPFFSMVCPHPLLGVGTTLSWELPHLRYCPHLEDLKNLFRLLLLMF